MTRGMIRRDTKDTNKSGGEKLKGGVHVHYCTASVFRIKMIQKMTDNQSMGIHESQMKYTVAPFTNIRISEAFLRLELMIVTWSELC